jgi:hypothetical protein
MNYDEQRLEQQRLEQRRQGESLERQLQAQRDELNRQESRRAGEALLRNKESSNRCVNNDGVAKMAGGLCVACYSAMRAAEESGDESPLEIRDYWRNFLPTLPEQKHHFASPKSKTERTDLFEEVTRRYGLELDDTWNKELVRHRGRHPDAYHSFVLGTMRFIDDEAKGDREKFLKLYDELVKETVMENPEMMRRQAWYE